MRRRKRRNQKIKVGFLLVFTQMETGGAFVEQLQARIAQIKIDVFTRKIKNFTNAHRGPKPKRLRTPAKH